jgi:hypothetical protein
MMSGLEKLVLYLKITRIEIISMKCGTYVALKHGLGLNEEERFPIVARFIRLESESHDPSQPKSSSQASPGCVE